MKQCQACRQPIAADATRCPYCRTLQMGAGRRAVNQIGAALLVVIAAIIVAALVPRCSL